MPEKEEIAVMTTEIVLKHLVPLQDKMLSIEDKKQLCEALVGAVIECIGIARVQASDEERKHVDRFVRIDRDDLLVF